MKTLIDVLEDRVRRSPDALLYRFLFDSSEPAELTASELKGKSLALARMIRAHVDAELGQISEPSILISTQNTERFIVGFFACLYAGVLAIPAPALSSQRKSFRLAQLVEHALPSCVLCDAEAHDGFRAFLDRHKCSQSTIVDFEQSGDIDPATRLPDVKENQHAFVQYTSGTTKQPRGAVISHKNVVSNIKQLQAFSEYRCDDRGVTWLPPYHDLGLTGCILHVLFAGADLTFISPFTFARDPLKWLQVISDYRITVSVGPNFAYTKCVQAAQKRPDLALDLRSWRTAHVCAEPVQASTLNQFIDTFAPHGFRSESFVVSYGMAEATLGVSAGRWDQKVQTFTEQGLISFIAEECYFNEDGAVELVSCGRPAQATEVVIVDPNSLRAKQEGELGEIWLRGPNYTKSYYRDEDETEKHLCAKIRGGDDKRYVRSSDIGFMKSGELYVVGRLDQFFWCQDRYFDSRLLEKTMVGVNGALADGACVALPLRSADDAELVIAQELKLGFHRNADTEQLSEMIRRKIVEETNWKDVVVKLVKPLHLPRTTSGKIQRYLCRQMYFSDALETVG